MIMLMLLIGAPILFAAIFLLFRSIVNDRSAMRIAATSFLQTNLTMWALAVMVAASGQTPDLVLAYVRMVFMYASLSAVGLLWFSSSWIDHKYRWGTIDKLLLLAGLSGAVFALTNLMISDVNIVNGLAFPERGIGYMVLIFFLVAIVVFSLAKLYRHGFSKKYIEIYSLSDRQRLQFMSVTLSIGTSLLIFTNVALPNIIGSVLPARWGGIAILILIAIIIYASLRYKLFDIRETAARSLVYILTLSALAFVYILVSYLMSSLVSVNGPIADFQVSPSNITVTFIIAFIFQPIKKFFDKLTDRIFYRNEYDKSEFIEKLGKMLAYTTDMRLMVERVSHYFMVNFKASQVSFAVKHKDSFRQFGTKAYFKLAQVDIQKMLEYAFMQKGYNQVYAISSISDQSLRRELSGRGIAIAMPLALQDEVVACLFLGEHKGKGYTVRDFKTLETVGSELVIALKNSLSVEEVRELNESLKQRIDDATEELRAGNQQLQKLDEAKNEFISMASHQLRTPLTSIKGYLDMVIQGDLGKIRPTQKTVLMEAFSSSERMVQLINDFLTVSRLQTGKFVIEREVSDIAQLIKEEVSLVKVMASQRGIDLKVKISKNLPNLNIKHDR